MVTASTPDEVVIAFIEIEQAVAAVRHAAGFVSYEAAAALNPDLPPGIAGDLPLVWFGIFRERIEVEAGGNERREVTEGSYTNVVVLLDGKLVTPSVRCGLLPGTFREALIEGGVLQERVLTLDDLRTTEEILLINSVRGWGKVYLNGE